MLSVKFLTFGDLMYITDSFVKLGKNWFKMDLFASQLLPII